MVNEVQHYSGKLTYHGRSCESLREFRTVPQNTGKYHESRTNHVVRRLSHLTTDGRCCCTTFLRHLSYLVTKPFDHRSFFVARIRGTMPYGLPCFRASEATKESIAREKARDRGFITPLA
jgi:hypothetical protein